MSDWTSVYSTIGPANGGLDLEMPKTKYFAPDKLKEALATGRITEKTIDEKVEHLLYTFIAFGLLDRVQKLDSIPLDYDRSRRTALDVAREGIVLLKNDGDLLPLKGRTLILGPNADTIVSGGGSGSVSPFSVVPAGKALKQLGGKKVTYLPDSELYLSIDDNIYADSALTVKGYAGRYFKNQKRQGTPDRERIDPKVNFRWEYGRPFEDFPDDHFSVDWTGYYVPATDGTIRIGISGDDGYRISVNDSVVAGDWGNHAMSSRQIEYDVRAGEKYKFRIDYFDNISSANISCDISMLDRAKLDRELRRADNVVYCTGFTGDVEGEGFDRSFALPTFQERMISSLAAVNPRLAVVLNAGGAVDLTRWGDDARAILMAWYPGQEGGQAIAEILTGKISPSGKLPITYDRTLADNPSYPYYYKNGDPKSRECDHVDYGEGIFTGYRGYDRAGKAPLYPFGYGLSYTTFKFSDLAIEKLPADSVAVSFTVSNTGRRAGAEVAQVYVGDSECSVPRPQKELKGFEKVALKPGESRRVTVVLPPDAFSFWSLDEHRFLVEPGEFKISVGNSSANLPLSGSVNL